MSFWQTSDNKALDNSGSFELGGNIEPMPNNTQLKAIIDEAVWDDYQGNRMIKLRWSVIDGEYKGRKVFHKVRIGEADAAKRDKALRMLAAIDTNSGGGLQRLGTEPSDMDLAINLMNKPMVIMVQVWSLTTETGDKMTGNWVSAVSPLNGVQQRPQAAAAQQQAQSQGFDDISF